MQMKKAGLCNPASLASAGNQGRLSNQVVEEIVLDSMIWFVEQG
jgi:hypothetical protein